MNVAVLAITSVNSVVSILLEVIPVVVDQAILCSQMDALAKVTINTSTMRAAAWNAESVLIIVVCNNSCLQYIVRQVDRRLPQLLLEGD